MRRNPLVLETCSRLCNVKLRWAWWFGDQRVSTSHCDESRGLASVRKLKRPTK